MRVILWVLVAVSVLAGSFLVTLWVLDQYFPVLGYDTAKFPRVEAGQTLTFGNGENRGALISGWSSPEPWGVWSDGHEAQLGFVPLGVRGDNARVLIECLAFLDAKVPEQRIEFWSQNVPLGDVSLAQRDNNRL